MLALACTQTLGEHTEQENAPLVRLERVPGKRAVANNHRELLDSKPAGYHASDTSSIQTLVRPYAVRGCWRTSLAQSQTSSSSKDQPAASRPGYSSPRCISERSRHSSSFSPRPSFCAGVRTSTCWGCWVHIPLCTPRSSLINSVPQEQPGCTHSQSWSWPHDAADHSQCKWALCVEVSHVCSSLQTCFL